MRFPFLALSVLVCSSCVAQDPYVVLRGERFTVELARSSDEQALGLMFRDSLADDHGMLFLFPGEARRGFWMKNMRIPLDIFYFDANLRLVSVAENAQPCRSQRCPPYPSAAPAKFVLELRAGTAAELGVRPGDVLELRID